MGKTSEVYRKDRKARVGPAGGRVEEFKENRGEGYTFADVEIGRKTADAVSEGRASRSPHRPYRQLLGRNAEPAAGGTRRGCASANSAARGTIQQIYHDLFVGV